MKILKHLGLLLDVTLNFAEHLLLDVTLNFVEHINAQIKKANEGISL